MRICPHCGAVDPEVRFIEGTDVCPATGYRDDDAVMCLACGKLSDPGDWEPRQASASERKEAA